MREDAAKNPENVHSNYAGIKAFSLNSLISLCALFGTAWLVIRP